MQNPLLSGAQPQIPNFSGFHQLANMIKTAQNPNAVLSMLAQKNPQFNQIIQKKKKKNPREVFIDECKRRGIDPNRAIQQMGLK